MCLRGREMGGGAEVLLHENSVQKDLRKRMGQVSYRTPAASGWRDSDRWRQRMESVSEVFMLYVNIGTPFDWFYLNHFNIHLHQINIQRKRPISGSFILRT